MIWKNGLAYCVGSTSQKMPANTKAVSRKETGMCQLMMRSAQGLLALRGTADHRKSLYTMVLIFCLIEYMVWTSSCFWAGDTIRNTYFWFAALLISCHPFFLWAVGKAEEA